MSTVSTLISKYERVNRKNLVVVIHLVFSFLYLFLLLVLPRIGAHLKVSELFLPFLTVSTFWFLPAIRKLFGDRLLLLIALFFVFTAISNLLSFFFLGTDLVYLIILPVRYIEILIPLFAIAISAYYRPQLTLLGFKYLFIFLFTYLILNFFMGFQTGYYGLVVLPGESGPIQVGSVFGLYSVLFLWMYIVSKNNSYQSSKHPLNKVFLFISPLFFVSSIMLVLNVQRTSILALLITILFAMVISFFLRYKKMIFQNIKLTIMLFIAFLVGLLVVTYFAGDIISTLFKVLRRFEAFESATGTRTDKWIEIFNLEVWSGMTSFLGVGLGAHNFFWGSGDFTLRFDSLPLRLLFEVGFFGVVIFALIHLKLLKLVYYRTKIVGLLAVLIMLFMMVMSITFEAPFVYIPGTMFYSFLGVSVGLSYNLQQRDSKKQFIKKRL